MTRTKEQYEVTKRLEHTKADMAYLLDVFGDTLAVREGYKAHSGIEAVQFYLAWKLGWTPAVVKALSADDMSFLMAEELAGWKCPPEANI